MVSFVVVHNSTRFNHQSMSTKLAKDVLRKRIKSDLAKLKPEYIESQSKIVCKMLSSLPEFQQAKSIGLYMNMPAMEINTHDIIKQCFEHQKKVYLPKCENKQRDGRRLRHLAFLSVPDMSYVDSMLPSGKYNLREPATGEDIMEGDPLDLLIVPGVAFSLSGTRLGHGAGYYDEFLHAYKAHFGRVPFLIGVGLKEQVSCSIPTESHDWTLNQVLVPYE